MNKPLLVILICLSPLLFAVYYCLSKNAPDKKPGQIVDQLHNIPVYYNGETNKIRGRNRSEEGYNFGLKYQCVEFVKRYYFVHFNHRMPNTYGNAKDFFNKSVKDGGLNAGRGLIQCRNPSRFKPNVSDLLVYSGHIFNKFGHVAIVSKVSGNSVEIIQQNPGPGRSSRETYKLAFKNGRWKIGNDRVLGWLRMKPE
mgnify:CR=1 FL=1